MAPRDHRRQDSLREASKATKLGASDLEEGDDLLVEMSRRHVARSYFSDNRAPAPDELDPDFRWGYIWLGPLRYVDEGLGLFLCLLSAVFFLSWLTQLGGLVLWFSCAPLHLLYCKVGRLWGQRQALVSVLLGFGFIYLLNLTLITPALASLNGRSPLPCFFAHSSRSHLVPATVLTCILGRNYVASDALKKLHSLARSFSAQEQGASIFYFDAGFPLFNKYPMPPRRGHEEGKTVDLAAVFHSAASQNSSFPSKAVERPPLALANYLASFAPGSVMSIMTPNLLHLLNAQRRTFDAAKTQRLYDLLVDRARVGGVKAVRLSNGLRKFLRHDADQTMLRAPCNSGLSWGGSIHVELE